MYIYFKSSYQEIARAKEQTYYSFSISNEGRDNYVQEKVPRRLSESSSNDTFINGTVPS